ncbi:hypothetical protein [Embleya sp. NPDC005575]|uniref:hypothetical protein n=1 Tax=Embleya sp. NPDC005575 TaxID=3156892 RepID=UPI0033A09EC9
MDVTTLAVALIGVGGTMGGTLGGAVLSQRARRVELAEQTQRTQLEREQQRDERALQSKRDQYAQLNATARAYRVAAGDAVRATERGENLDARLLDSAREAWAELYAQAQMMLTKELLDITSELNQSLGLGYAVVKQLPNSTDQTAACRHAKAWFTGPLSDGVYLLRVALRHDLGVEVDADFEQTSRRIRDALSRAHADLARQLDAERRQITTP